MTHATTLRALLADTSTPLVVPGAGTPLEARAIEQAGFGAAYLSGYAIAAWRYGLPDIGLLGAREALDALTAVARVTDLPLIVDADTGYGDATSVWANVRLLEAAGAAAIQLEDQVWPKKCGHMVGKEVIDADEAVRKVATAVEARRNPDTVIIARTDSLAPRGLDEALSRAARFRDAGADVVFIDAPSSVDDLTRIGSTLDGPLMANMSEGGVTPLLTADEFHALGFQLVIFPTTPLRVASLAIEGFLADLRTSGDSKPWRERMHGLDELNELVGLDDYLSIGDRASAMVVE
ncbi:oxaloacetate decarboxylase [Subtercola sp. Z020]|uniref:isocitrate lyase/PEP mutase family protein n=1 Tax=Subtercola sp. Z020 TaxID=2080582 RepID=UPI00130EAFDB|nr:oxaloacetate decarboxylase [Subtercola sp. Z020]